MQVFDVRFFFWGGQSAASLHYETKQPNDEVPVMPEFWGMQSTSSLPYLPGHSGPGVLEPDKVLCPYSKMNRLK